MYTGTMIEELVSAVVRAERNAAMEILLREQVTRRTLAPSQPYTIEAHDIALLGVA